MEGFTTLMGHCRHGVRDGKGRVTVIEGNIRLVSVGEGLRKAEGNKEKSLKVLLGF